jgi:hypothetical protein
MSVIYSTEKSKGKEPLLNKYKERWFSLSAKRMTYRTCRHVYYGKRAQEVSIGFMATDHEESMCLLCEK